MTEVRPGRFVFDWEFLLARAYEIGIPPAAFWRMTFFEFSQCIVGHNAKLEAAREFKAWEIANLLSAWCTKPVTIDEVLGRAKKFETADELRKAALRMQADLDQGVAHNDGAGRR